MKKYTTIFFILLVECVIGQTPQVVNFHSLTESYATYDGIIASNGNHIFQASDYINEKSSVHIYTDNFVPIINFEIDSCYGRWTCFRNSRQ